MSRASRVGGRPRSLGAELPAVDEVRARPVAEGATAEELRLASARSPVPRPSGPLAATGLGSAPPAPTAHAMAALEAAVGRLRAAHEAPALMAIDETSRAALAARLEAITEMARTACDLLALRREASGRLRSGGGPV